MRTLTRRGHLKTLLGAAAAPPLWRTHGVARLNPGPANGWQNVAGAIDDTPVPREGIGRGIRHLAYSDIGGRPDSVQIMMNRRHLYCSPDSITNRKKFRSGLAIHDISRPGEMREIAFLEMPGLGINRLWWTGGRSAYVAAHFDGFTDHILCIVDLKAITKPVNQ